MILAIPGAAARAASAAAMPQDRAREPDFTLLACLLVPSTRPSAARTVQVISTRWDLLSACRLGQMSEFSLLIAVLASQLAIIRAEVSYLIQIATLVSFVFSSYYIVARYPTPIALSDKLRRD